MDDPTADPVPGQAEPAADVSHPPVRLLPMALTAGGAAALVIIVACVMALLARRAPLPIEPIPDQSVDELSLLEFTVGPRDDAGTSVPLEFRLTDAPEGAEIDPASGNFTWTPTETQGPGSYKISVLVTAPDLRKRWGQRFGVEVREVLQAPALEPVLNRTVEPGDTVSFQVRASDPDVPSSPIRFRLGPDAPAEARIDSVRGTFTWTPPADEPGNAYPITIEAGKPGLSAPTARATFHVAVARPKVEQPPEPELPVPALVEWLRASGSTVTTAAEPPAHPSFSGEPTWLEVDGRRVGVFLYPTPEAASADATRLGPDDLEPFARLLPPPSAAYVFQGERLVVWYLGARSALLLKLSERFGRPVASKSIDVAPMAEPTPEEDKGDDIIFALYEKNRLLNKTEYPTLRGVHARRFERRFAAEIDSVFGDQESPMRQWLEDHTEIKEELFLAIDPEHDDVVRAMELFHTLWEENPDKIEPYANLAIAVSVVWDRERGAIHGTPRGQHHSLQPDGEMDALENFRYYASSEPVMAGRTRFLPWEFLVHMVNHRTTLQERVWAVQTYLPKRVKFGKCYHDVPYDYEMLGGKAPPRISGKPHTLQNARAFGGVCTCQADFAARVGKSIGVPAFSAGAPNRYGDGHAWVMWVELGNITRTGFNFSLESHGRYRGDKYYVGGLGDPHTGQRTTDRETELRLHTVGMDPVAKRQADLVMQAYPMLRERAELDTTGELVLLNRVINLCPGNEAAWKTLAGLSRDGKITKTNSKPMASALDRLFITFAKVPDFTWTVFDDMIAFQDMPKQRAKLFGRLATMYEQAGRPDLSCKARLKYTEYLVADERYEEAVECLAASILLFPDEGRYVPGMLDKLEELATHVDGSDQQIAAFYQKLLPLIPQKRGDSPSAYCMKMYERGIQRFRQAGAEPLARAYEAQLATLRATGK